MNDPIAVRGVDSPLGPLLLAATPAALLEVAFAPGGGAPRHPVLDRAARQLDEYFAGRRRRFELPLDLGGTPAFRRRVLEELARIPYGATATYGGVAAAAGSPRAVRAAGTACATNPLPIVVPCHRVVRADGALGPYLGGAGAKQALLDLEAA